MRPRCRGPRRVHPAIALTQLLIFGQRAVITLM